jgi:hypothetical protein
MATRLRPQRASLLVDEKGLRAWLATAKSGDVIEYHRGVLAIDRLARGSRLGERNGQELNRVADLLFAMTGAGRGHLLQRRHGDGDYSYLFVLRSQTLAIKAHALALAEVTS